MRKAIVAAAVFVLALGLLATGGLYWFFSGDGMRVALEQQATSWLGHPVRVGQARARLFPRPGIELTDVRAGEAGEVTLADVRLTTDLGGLLGRRISGATISIADTRLAMPLPFRIPWGNAAAAPGNAPAIEIESIDAIALRDVRIASRDREVVVSADLGLSGDRLAVRQFTAESGATSLQVEGSVGLAPRIDATLTARAPRLDLDELLALAQAFSPEPAAGGGPAASAPVRLAATVAADTATAGGVTLSALTADMTVDGDRVALVPMTFGLFGGRYEGALRAQLGETLSATIESRLDGLDVAALTTFAGSPDTVTGRLDAAGTFRARGRDVAALLAGATGTGTASIVDGTIRRLDLVRTVVLFFGRPAPDTAASTDRFERIDAGFSLADRVVRAERLALRSRDADIAGTGTLALSTEALNGRLDMMLSEELSAQAGTDLARFTREGSRIVLPAALGGTLSAPRLSIDARAALQRGLRNEAQRRLGDLFDRLRGGSAK